MDKNLKDQVFIVMPAYNESQTVEQAVKHIQEHGYKNIVVVNDGSKDNTYEVLQKIKGIYALSHKINRGAGAATQTGIEFSVLQGAKYVVLIDADGQHSVEEIGKMLEPVVRDECDITIGTRFVGDNQKSNVPLSKKIALRIGILYTWIVSGVLLTDAHNGFKAMNVKAANETRFLFDRFEFCSETVDIIKVKNLRYKEVPVTVIYTEYSMAKGQRLSNGIKIALNMVWYKLNKILFK